MTTLKISDLSVGDWVRYIRKRKKNDDYFQVAHIFRGEKEWLVGRKNDDIFGSHSLRLKDIEPIPLTPEVLEKNGFARGQRGSFYHYLRLDKNRTLYIHASTNGWRVEITYDAAGILRTTHLMPDMNSVHQLQHALRLAGLDKEINL